MRSISGRSHSGRRSAARATIFELSRFARTGAKCAASLGLAATAIASAPVARADGAAAEHCISAAEQSQPLRRDGKLLMARERLLACSRAECPSVVRTDCIKWLADLDAVMPQVVLSAVDSGGTDLVDVRVFIDGEPVAQELTGREISIDPGVHTIRFERSGSKAIEQKIVVRETERHRVISAKFEDTSSAPPAPAARTSAAPAPGTTASNPEEGGARARSLAAPLALLGVGAAGLGVASYFWATGMSDRSTLESQCAPTHSCTQSAVDSAHGKLLAGDIVGGLGIVSAVVGGAMLVFGGRGTTVTSRGPTLRVQALAGGATLSVLGPLQ